MYWRRWGKIMFRSTISSLPVAMVLILLSAMAQAVEYRRHEAHAHGVAHLNVAIEGNRLYIEFSSPAANIVGFEHRPRTQDQKGAIQAAIQKLKKGDKLFVLPPGSRSQLETAEVDTDIDDHDSHGTDSGHVRKDNDHHASEDSHDKDHHDADGHENERHSEFKAKYQFSCDNPKALSHIQVKLFQAFPGIEHIEVQLVTEQRQTAQDLTQKEKTIRF